MERIRNVTDYQNEILDLYDQARHKGETRRGRRYIRWRNIQNLDQDLTPTFMQNLTENVRTAFYLRHVYAYQLTNIRTGNEMIYYRNAGSPWMNTFAEAEAWIREREQERFEHAKIQVANTEWVYDDRFSVDLKVVIDRQHPLMGVGCLPGWLRNLAHGRVMVSLDTYQDNLCLWRCIVVHQGVRSDRSTAAARPLAKGFYKLERNWPKTSLEDLGKVERYLNKGTNCENRLGIRDYEPERKEGDVLW